MCGIAGIWSNTLAPAERERLVRTMLSCMPERGPDALNIMHCDNLTLGFLRLSIVGVNGVTQPVESALALSMINGEVYNYRDLWDALPDASLSGGLTSDASVLAPLYQEDPSRFLERLNGIFAGVIYDRKHQSLLLFRDHVGVKPLFYTRRNDGFVFASTVAAVRSVVSAEIDHAALRRYLVCGYVQTPRTLLREVCAVRPGSLILLSAPHVTGVERNWFSYTAATTDIRQSIEGAVRSQIPEGWPVVSTLSGGVDSTLVTLLLQRYGANPTALTVKYPSDECSEECSEKCDEDLLTARLVSKRYGVAHVEVSVTPADYYAEVTRPWRFDQPLADPNAIAFNRLCQHTQTLGSRVLITGDGSDELFCGYDYYRAGRQGIIRSRLAASVFDSMADRRDREFFRRVTGFPYVRPMRLIYGEPLNSMQRYDLQNWLEPNLLVKSDRFGMADQVEVRVPFLQPDIVRLALSLPPHLKINRSETKIALKAAFADILPDVVVNRMKRGFPCPISGWLRGDLGRQLRQDASWAVDNAWDIQREQALWSEHLSCTADWGQQLWRLVVARAWWRSVAEQ